MREKMRKVKNEDVIEILEEVRINEDTVLEVGDKIKVSKKVLNEDVFRQASEKLEKALKDCREPSGFNYSMTDEVKSMIKSLLNDYLYNNEFEDLDFVELEITEESLMDFFEENYDELSRDDCIKWLGQEKGRISSWVDDALESRENLANFTHLVNYAKKLALASNMGSIIKQIEKDIDYMLTWNN